MLVLDFVNFATAIMNLYADLLNFWIFFVVPVYIIICYVYETFLPGNEARFTPIELTAWRLRI